MLSACSGLGPEPSYPEAWPEQANVQGDACPDLSGVFRLEMPQIVPAFGQPHGHLAYDGDAFETVFLRPVMPRSRDTSLDAHFVLQPV